MSNTLTAKQQTLADIFSDAYVFTIPGYQRPYSWGKDQAQELLDDLLSALMAAPEVLSEATPYFLGSIVLIKGETSAEATVVDGQQGLTTLTVLLSAIRAAAQDAGLQADISSCIYEKGTCGCTPFCRRCLTMATPVSRSGPCSTSACCRCWSLGASVRASICQR